jgi:tetratricopeptide (TPR) repeat protein
MTRLDWLRESKRGNEALALADQLVRREPTNARLLNERCWIKATLGIATQSAVADCDAALKLSPATPNYLDSRGLAKFRLGEFEDALADYDAALTLRPGMAASLYGRGLTRARLGLAKSAAADFAAARQANAGIDAEFAGYGLAAPDASATASLDAVRPVAQLHAPAAAPM